MSHPSGAPSNADASSGKSLGIAKGPARRANTPQMSGYLFWLGELATLAIHTWYTGAAVGAVGAVAV